LNFGVTLWHSHRVLDDGSGCGARRVGGAQALNLFKTITSPIPDKRKIKKFENFFRQR